jgi:sugar/nucleoside kinase (ribokinase family)
MSERGVITIVGDIARDVNVHVDVTVPDGLVVAGDTPARIRTGLGGSATATAAWLAYRGVSVRLVGARGEDFAGSTTLDELRQFGVEPHIQVVHGARTGTVVVIVDSTGERSMLPDPGANAALSTTWCIQGLVGRHLHISAYSWFRRESRSAIEAMVEEARVRGMTVSIDLNSHGLVRDHLGPLQDMLDRVDVVFANSDEWQALDDQWTPPEHCVVVVKRGAAGASWGLGDATGSSPAVPVTLIDSTGTGDAYAAGFLAAWVNGGGVSDSVAAGNELAALCATRVGPVPDFLD